MNGSSCFQLSSGVLVVFIQSGHASFQLTLKFAYPLACTSCRLRCDSVNSMLENRILSACQGDSWEWIRMLMSGRES